MEKRTIIFIDESGLSERPYRVRTWAPRGLTGRRRPSAVTARGGPPNPGSRAIS
jgi:hypothetical protein